MNKSDIKNQLSDKGYVHIKKFFSCEAIECFENAVIDLYLMQATKIADYRHQAFSIKEDRVTACRSKTINALVCLLEQADKPAAYEVQKMLNRSQRVRALFDDCFMSEMANIAGFNPSTTLLDGPALFVNQPGVDRLLYRWHTEALYYPKRRKFLNIWLPMFTPRTLDNGAMSVMLGSHKRAWTPAEVNEYTGWNKDAEGKKNQFGQLEVCENFLQEYERYECVSEPRDIIAFDRNLVHTSNPNKSELPAFAVVCRVWDPSDDLTLSGDIAVSFGNNLGRANLVVNP